MSHLSASEKRYLDNAALIGAQTVIYTRLAQSGVPVFKLADIADTASGGTPDRTNSSYFEGSIPWMKSGELNDGIVTAIEESITETGLECSSAKVFPAGTLLIALYGATVGKTGVLGIDAATNQAVCSVIPKRNDIRVAYLHWFLRHKREDFLISSFGGAQPNISQRILRDTLVPIPSPAVQDAVIEFLDAVEQRMRDRRIPLPDVPPLLAEQRRVVARIEELAAQIHEARSLRHEASLEAEVLLANERRRYFGSATSAHDILLEDVCQSIIDTLHSDPTYADDGVPCVRSPDIKGGRLDLSRALRTTDEEFERRTVRGRPQEGDIVYCRQGGGTGRAALVRDGDRFSLGQAMMMFRPNPQLIDPTFFLHQLLSPTVVEDQLAPCFIGTASPRVNIGALRKFRLVIPSIVEQRQVAVELDALQAEVDALKRLQAETAAELDALLPAILDRAFKGEL